MGEVDIGGLRTSLSQTKLSEAQNLVTAQKAKADVEAEQKKMDSAETDVPRDLFGTGAGLNVTA